MAWMKIELELPDKPEVHYIAGVTGLDPDAVVGKLIRIWQWFDKHTEDGNALGVTFALPDRISGVTGFGEAMSLAGWLVQSGSVLTMPKFDRHNGESAKKRALTAERVAKSKQKSNAPSVTEALPTALPREEKIREDSKPINTKAERNANATRLPPDWTPSEDQIYFCKTERPDLNPQTVADRFRDHWIASPGSKGRKLDWNATWRNWVRNERIQNARITHADRKAERDNNIAILTGRAKNERTSTERDITGEAFRIA